MKLTDLKIGAKYRLDYCTKDEPNYIFTGEVGEVLDMGFNCLAKAARFTLYSDSAGMQSFIKGYYPTGKWLIFYESDYKDSRYNNYSNNSLKEISN